MAEGALVSMFHDQLASLHAAVARAGRVMITATEREDGDSIAAELAVRHIIQAAFPLGRKTVHIINERRCPRRYQFLEGAEEILSYDEIANPAYDVGVVVDCGADRSGRVGEIFKNCPFRVKIDHHAVGNEGVYHLEVCANQVASTTEILFLFVDDPCWSTPLTPRLAELIYVGMICDTGAFQYDLTRPSTHRVAARLLATGFDFPLVADRVLLARNFEMKKLLGLVLNRMERAPHGKYLWSVLTPEMIRQTAAGPDDAGDIIDALCFVNGVDVSVLFVELENGQVRISFRSKGGMNVGEFARTITPTGGGHPRASGCVIPGPLDRAIREVRAALDREQDR